MFYTSDELIDSIKLRCLAPVSQSVFEESDLLLLANEDLQLHLVPDILSIREDFFLNSKSVSLSANVSNYPIPERAMGNALKQVYYVDGNGNRRQVVHSDIEIKREYINNQYGIPLYFFFEGDEISLVPTPNVAGGTLEFWYFQRVNELVLTESVTKITAISVGASTTTFTVNTDLTASITAGTTKLDILSGTSPFLLWAQDITASSVGASSLVVANSDIQNAAGSTLPQVNDYVCLAQQSNIPMVPQEFHPVLAQMVSCRILEALGHLDKLQAAQAKLEMMRQSAAKMVMNRVELQPRTVINRNNLLGNARFGWF